MSFLLRAVMLMGTTSRIGFKPRELSRVHKIFLDKIVPAGIYCRCHLRGNEVRMEASMRPTTIMNRTAAKSPTPKNRFETPLAQPAYSKEDFNQKVQETAYQLFVARGYAHGYDLEDWLRAEQIVKGS